MISKTKLAAISWIAFGNTFLAWGQFRQCLSHMAMCLGARQKL